MIQDLLIGYLMTVRVCDQIDKGRHQIVFRVALKVKNGNSFTSITLLKNMDGTYV